MEDLDDVYAGPESAQQQHDRAMAAPSRKLAPRARFKRVLAQKQAEASLPAEVKAGGVSVDAFSEKEIEEAKALGWM